MSDKLSSQKGNKNGLTVDDYRGLIEDLEKFVEKSSNMSVPIGNGQIVPPQVGRVAISDKDMEVMQEKSTKESNFVAENKQHFLRRAQEAIASKVQ